LIQASDGFGGERKAGALGIAPAGHRRAGHKGKAHHASARVSDQHSVRGGNKLFNESPAFQTLVARLKRDLPIPGGRFCFPIL